MGLRGVQDARKGRGLSKGLAPLFTIHANDQAHLDEVRDAVLAAHVFSDSAVERLPLFYE